MAGSTESAGCFMPHAARQQMSLTWKFAPAFSCFMSGQTEFLTIGSA